MYCGDTKAGWTAGMERTMRMEILEGVALVGGWGPDGYFCPSGHIVLDARTNEPTSCLNFSGRAWADPFMPSMVLLDDPHTAVD